jgi:hypothetical protein
LKVGANTKFLRELKGLFRDRGHRGAEFLRFARGGSLSTMPARAITEQAHATGNYADLEEFDINPSQLDFKSMPAPNAADHEHAPHEPAGGEKPLTIQQAKAGLAITFGVTPSQIEITIRA